MRCVLILAFAAITAIITLMVPPLDGGAGDDARAIITAAIKAHGGADRVAKLQSVRMKTKGTLTANNQSADFTAEFITKLPDRGKMVMALDLNMNQIDVVQVHSGKQAWWSINGQTQELEGDKLAEQQARTHTNRVCSLTPLLGDKAFALSPLGETKIEDRPARGVRVVMKGQPDVSLFFDKDNGLLVKVERRGQDLAQNDVLRETFYSDYKDYDGVKQASKMVVRHDGQRYLEMEITELQFPEMIGDEEFARP
jgi:hypothetical protein